MGSWLLVPADKEKALAQAASAGADVVVLDLARASSEDRKQHTRLAARDFLMSHREQVVAARKFSRWVRIGPIVGMEWRQDLDAAIEGGPEGFVLAECVGPEQVKELAAALYELEGRLGIPNGSTKIIPEVGGSPTSALQLRSFAEELHPRVSGLAWDPALLARSMGARRMRGPGGLWTDALAHVRALVLLTAHARNLEVIEAPFRNLREPEGMTRAAAAAAADGFTGMLAIDPSQVDDINKAFEPSQEQIAEARELVGVFALNPNAHSIAFRGRYVGQAELSKARALLGEG
ncbi:CoA ester lyase [Qipengyuania xiapuensis]|uniref:CoA ester lyase n=1 Tax=Qipengyuania xiapuensis TaxID=2867236 RepID=A0ABX8ZVC5_9SPHN|nr:aldolase/citrate lyase family protein [Qipengyuania xiapuensis]QZD92059.1 CoA ester lyase [Qipengyuania xiapuensis]